MNPRLDSLVDLAVEQPDGTARRRSFRAVACLLLLGACAQQPKVPPPDPRLDALEQRLQALERRVDILEHHILALPSAPVRSRDEIESEVKSLQSRRSALLERYTTLHPEVREIDLRLRLLKLQLDMMDQARKEGK